MLKTSCAKKVKGFLCWRVVGNKERKFNLKKITTVKGLKKHFGFLFIIYMSRKFTSNSLDVSYLVSQTIFPASFHHKGTIIPSFCLPQAVHHVCGCIFPFSNASVSALVNIKALDINYGKRDCVNVSIIY